MTETFMAAEIAEAGAARDANSPPTRRRQTNWRQAARAETLLRRDHRARKLGPCGPFSQICGRDQARARLRLARTLDRFALPGALASRRRGRHDDFPVRPQPRHRRHAARGETGRRNDGRAGQRCALAARGRGGRAPAAAAGRRALRRRDQVDDRFACRRRLARRALERGRGLAAALDRLPSILDASSAPPPEAAVETLAKS